MAVHGVVAFIGDAVGSGSVGADEDAVDDVSVGANRVWRPGCMWGSRDCDGQLWCVCE